MTQEEKQLLIRDLCARLPYGVKLRYVEDLVVKKESHIITLNNIYLEHILNGDADIKPYLRPMSSMTEEEKKDFSSHIMNDKCDEDGVIIDVHDITSLQIYYYYFKDVIDWLLAHHFDYRGLIEKGLALEAPEDMYKTE